MRTALLCFAAALLVNLPASPQALELGVTGGYGVLSDNTLSVEEYADAVGRDEFLSNGLRSRDEFSMSNGLRIGARMGFNPKAFLGHEVSYAYQRMALDYLSSGPDTAGSRELGAVQAHHMAYNLVLHALPEGSPLRPFVTGGGGFSSFFLPGVSSFSGYGNTKFGYNYGAGVKFNFFLYGLRLDFRNHVTGKPFGEFIPNVTGNLNNYEFSVTFSLLLG